jgi:hypothetical protein
MAYRCGSKIRFVAELQRRHNNATNRITGGFAFGRVGGSKPRRVWRYPIRPDCRPWPRVETHSGIAITSKFRSGMPLNFVHSFASGVCARINLLPSQADRMRKWAADSRMRNLFCLGVEDE